MNLTQRALWKMVVLMIITCGFYLLYWLIVTKQELNVAGAQVPTAFLIIIPFANIYFLYKFAQAFCTLVLKKSELTVAYFLLITLLPPIGALIYQSHINELQPARHPI